MSTPSTLVADRYRLVKMLGAGGMGIVWQAWDERLHRTVALKMLRTQPELTDSERQLATDRAMREARITAGLHHPAAVTVFDVVEHDGQPCIVMQLIESTPLSVLLSEHGTLTPFAAARIGAQVASALAAAHKLRIVHRDVKPGNILITADGSAMISDFGISHALGDTTITATGLIHGTPAYLAPEVARGLPTSFASDVFSLGSTLYAMLEGTPPFGADKNAIALLHKVAHGGYPPPAHAGPLAPLLGEMLSTNAKSRPTMASVVESLSALQEDPSIPGAPPAAIAVPTERSSDDMGSLAGAGAAAAVAADAAADVATDAFAPEAAAATTEAFTPNEPTAATTKALAPDAPTAATKALAPTAGTIPVDQPTRYEPPTAETERLGAAAASAGTATRSAPADVPPPASVPAVDRSPRRGRRAGVIVGILVLVGALVAGAAMLFNPSRLNVDDDAGPTASRTPSAATPTQSTEPTPTSSPRPVTPAPTPSVPPAAEEEPEPPPPTPEQRAVDMISDYYAMLPGDLDSAWPSMTADYQENHAGGRGGYEAFWSTVTALEVADIIASAPDQAQATLTYHFSDGRVVQEVTSFRLVEEGGALKIAETDVLSSSQF